MKSIAAGCTAFALLQCNNGASAFVGRQQQQQQKMQQMHRRTQQSTNTCCAYGPRCLRPRSRHQGQQQQQRRWSPALQAADVNLEFFKPFLEKDFRLADEEMKPYTSLKVGSSDKIVNLFGLWTFVMSLLTGPIWAAAMFVLNAAYEADTDNQFLNKWDPNRAIYDGTGKVWARVWLALTMSTPTLSGDVGRLREGQGACLYVANHASWLDIPVLCTVLDPVFKFIAKGELGKVPCIGQQLTGGKHIMINREDRKSQFLTFKEGLGWLKSGVPIMAFPEGQRSPEGRLIDFKGGIFSMAVKSKVPIVPISLSNTNAVMPGNSLFPVQPGAGKLHIHVHDSIDTEGLSEAEIADKVREALLSKMPECQHPIPAATTAIDAAVGETAGMTHARAAEAIPEAEITDAVLRAENNKNEKNVATEKKGAVSTEENEPKREDEKQTV